MPLFSTSTATSRRRPASAVAIRCRTPDAFEAAARRAGIGRDTLVVAYDEAGEGGAARLWWLLRHFGHDAVSVLDGGLRAWREEGGELRAGEERIEPGDFRAAAHAGERHGAGARSSPRQRMPRAAGSCSSTPARPSATAARSSRSMRSPGTSPARVNVPFAELAPNGPLPAARGAARPLRGRRCALR